MRYKIENFDDTSDARSFMNAYKSSCSYNFLKYVMYILVVTLISVVIWSVYAEKDIVVNAAGVINVSDNVCNIYIENTSIGNIQEGNDVQLEIVSLSRNDYGVIKSKIDDVSNDVLGDESSNKKFYAASCGLSDTVLTDRNGKEVELKNGMEAKVSIITYKTSYFNYIAGKLIS